MNEVTISAAVFFGILLRFGLPLIFTIGLASLLKRLDERWRAEGELEAAQEKVMAQQAALLQMWLQQPCWEIKNCSKDQQALCKAFQQKDIPCWETFRANGKLNYRCQTCEYQQTLTESVIMN